MNKPEPEVEGERIFSEVIRKENRQERRARERRELKEQKAAGAEISFSRNKKVVNSFEQQLSGVIGGQPRYGKDPQRGRKSSNNSSRKRGKR